MACLSDFIDKHDIYNLGINLKNFNMVRHLVAITEATILVPYHNCADIVISGICRFRSCPIFKCVAATYLQGYYTDYKNPLHLYFINLIFTFQIVLKFCSFYLKYRK